MEMYRQGDLLFIKSDKPALMNWNKLNRSFIIQSSITGHAHSIDNNTVLLSSNDGRGLMYIYSDEKLKITHEEHDTLILPEGAYEIRRQRELRGMVYD